MVLDPAASACYNYVLVLVLVLVPTVLVFGMRWRRGVYKPYIAALDFPAWKRRLRCGREAVRNAARRLTVFAPGGRASKRWRVVLLACAICLAAIAQANLPPPEMTLPQDGRLPHPLWQTLLFLRGPLEPFRMGIWLYLAAMLLVIVALSGTVGRWPWRSLALPGGAGSESRSGRSRLARLAIILIALALALGGLVFLVFYRHAASNRGLALWLLAIWILLAAVTLYEAYPRGGLTWAARLLAVSSLALIAAATAFLWRGQGALGMVCWLGGTLALAFGWRSAERQARAASRQWHARLEWLAVVVVLLMAVGFRVAHLSELGPGINNDAAEAARSAIYYGMGRSAYTPYITTGWGFESLFIYVIAAWLRLVGWNYFALRLAGITAGVAAVAAVYALAREMGGRRLAWISALLLAVSGIHIVYSTVGGHRLILQPLLDTLTLLFFWRAFDRRRLCNFLLAGLALGFSVQAHNSSRANAVLVCLFVLFLFLNAHSRREFWRRYRSGLAVLGIGTFAAAAPILAYSLAQPTEYYGRARYLFVGDRMQAMEERSPGAFWDPLARNVVVASLVFNQRGNANDFFIEEPAFDVPVSVLLVLALAYAVRYWRQPVLFFLLVWFAVGLLSSVLSEPNANRSLGAVVPACIMIGLFLLASADRVAGAFGERGRLAANAAIAALLAAVGWLSYQVYAGPNYHYRWGYADEASAVGRYVNMIRDYDDVYLTSNFYISDVPYFMTLHSGQDPYACPFARLDVPSSLAGQFPATRPVALVLGTWPEDLDLKDTLLERYPGSQVDPIPRVHTPWTKPGPAAYSILISPSVIESPARLESGLFCQYYKGPDRTGEPYLTYVDRFLSFPGDPPFVPFSVSWQGETEISPGGDHDFYLTCTNRCALRIDGKLVLQVDPPNADDPNQRREDETRVTLDEGRHAFQIEYSYEEGERVLELFWRRPDGELERMNWAGFTPLVP